MIYDKMTIGDLSFKAPIIQGGMGIGVSTSSLAGAVSKNGGLGVISGVQIGYKEADFETNSLEANKRALTAEIKKAKEICHNAPIAVNLMVAMNNYKDLALTAVEAGIDVIISGAGIPSELPSYVKDHTVKLVPIVSSLKAAKVINKFWTKNYNRKPDAIIVEGPLAGGHLGFKPKDLLANTTKDLETIVSEIVSYFNEIKVDMPIIAAGGIYNGHDIAKFLKLGASGVQMGTRFVPTDECDASDAYKNAYISATKDDIKIINSPVGLPGRALSNAFVKRVDAEHRIKPTSCNNCLSHCNPSTIPFCINTALINAVKGNLDEGLIFVGEKAYLCHEIQPVKQVMSDLLLEVYYA